MGFHVQQTGVLSTIGHVLLCLLLAVPDWLSNNSREGWRRPCKYAVTLCVIITIGTYFCAIIRLELRHFLTLACSGGLKLVNNQCCSGSPLQCIVVESLCLMHTPLVLQLHVHHKKRDVVLHMRAWLATAVHCMCVAGFCV